MSYPQEPVPPPKPFFEGLDELLREFIDAKPDRRREILDRIDVCNGKAAGDYFRHHLRQAVRKGRARGSPSASLRLVEMYGNGGYVDCRIDLHVGPISYHGEDPIWDISQPLFIEDATVNFTRGISAPEEQPQSK